MSLECRALLLGWLVACASPYRVAEPDRAPALRGRDFLAGLFDADLQLLPEYRGAKVYWLSHDNYLAVKVLAESHPEISKAIAGAIRREGLPRTDGKTELLFGDSPDLLPFHEYELIDVRRAGDKVLRTEIKTSRPMKGWEGYADLLFFASMARREPKEARRLWDKAMEMWDGKGFNDAATKGQGSYATYKLALAAIAAARLPGKPELPKALADRLSALEAGTGGWVTNYTASGKTLGVSNVETTCLAILGLEAIKAPSTKRPNR